MRAESRRLADLRDPVTVITAVGDTFAALDAELERIARVRLAAVRRLRTDGWSYDRIAAATGLSKGRVAQLSKDVQGWRTIRGRSGSCPPRRDLTGALVYRRDSDAVHIEQTSHRTPPTILYPARGIVGPAPPPRYWLGSLPNIRSAQQRTPAAFTRFGTGHASVRQPGGIGALTTHQ